MTDPENSPTADWWCWTEDEPSTFRCRELGHDVRPVRKIGDPSTAEWREAAGLPPLPPKWEGADYLKRQVARAEQERDAVGVKLVAALRERDQLAVAVTGWVARFHAAYEALYIEEFDGDSCPDLEATIGYAIGAYRRVCESEAKAADQIHMLRAELASARQELEQLRKDGRIFARVVRDLNAELEQLRAARQWIVARDGGRYCERCEAEIRRGEAYQLEPGVDELRHIHCPNERNAT